MRNTVLKKLTITAMMTALAVIFGFITFPIPISFFPAHLTYDICDVFILIISFIFGPLYGALSSVSVAVIQALLPNGSGPYGFIMNIISTMSFVLPSSLIYLRLKSKKGAVIALALGSVCMTVVMVVANYVVTPHFMGIPTSAIDAIIIPTTIFNLIKATANSIITFFVYKHIGRLIKKFY